MEKQKPTFMKDGQAQSTAQIPIKDGEAQPKYECPLNFNAILTNIQRVFEGGRLRREAGTENRDVIASHKES
jgi:hypothetical protein